MLLLALISCSCGETEFGGAQAAKGSEQCGHAQGSSGRIDDQNRVHLTLNADVGYAARAWRIELETERSALREGAELSVDAGTLSGRTCYLQGETCEHSAALSGGTLSVGDTELREDPCDLGADWLTTLEWALEFGEPGSEQPWARSTGDDALSLSISALCVAP
ncbi:MAG: hypothetical protein VX899_16615 [Myxococcota bacterium]|nr:hypothetical protein [Myxococcota bacterium]